MLINFSELVSVLLRTLTGVLSRLVNPFLSSLPLVVKPYSYLNFKTSKMNTYDTKKKKKLSLLHDRSSQCFVGLIFK